MRIPKGGKVYAARPLFRQHWPHLLPAVTAALCLASASQAAPLINPLAQERWVSVSVVEFTLPEPVTHLDESESASDFGLFDHTLNADFDGVWGGQYESGFAWAQHLSNITANSITFAGEADSGGYPSGATNWFNVASEAFFLLDFELTEEIDFELNYEIETSSDSDPFIAFSDLGTGAEILGINAFGSCPGGGSGYCAGTVTGSLAAGTYRILADGVEGASYYPLNARANFSLTVSPIPEPSTFLLVATGMLIIGGTRRSHRACPH